MKITYFTICRIALVAFIMLLTAANGVAQTNLIVEYKDQTKQTFSLGETGRIYFEDSNLFIDEGSGIAVNIELKNIQKLLINNDIASVIDHFAGDKLYIYPNPANDFLNIVSSVSENLNIAVFSLSGKIVLQTLLNGSGQVDVSRLIPGFYVIKINDSTFKFSKQ